MGSQLLFFVLVLSGFSLLCVQAQPLAPTTTDTLTQGNFIKDGETIISRKRVFELGFFTPPGADPAVRYLGIWYYNVTPQAVIWVANRKTSLRTRTGRFGISTNRNLELLEGGGANSTATVVWSSVSPSVPNASAVLMDSGNLVLRTTRGNTTVWESFANPGDTFMPGMRITVDRDSDEGNIVFKSWRSPSDPAVGRYSVGLDPSGSAQIYMWEDTSAGKKIRWRSGPWDGQVFVGTKMRPLFIFGFKLAEEQGRVSMTFSSAFNTSVLYRFVLQPDGVENTTTLDEKTKQWSQVWAQPVTACEFYNHCGANAECDDSTGSATCRCLHGYDPKSTDTWRKGDWSEGCVRRTRLQCQNGTSNGEDGFQKVEGIKPPDFAEWLPSSANEPLCREACLGNCSCRGYAFISNGCRVWARDLLDIHRFPGVSGSANGVIFLKLAAADLTAEGGKKNKTWVIALSVSLAAAAILLVCLCLWWRCRTRVQGTQDVKTGRNNSQSPFSAIDFTSYDPSSVGEDGKSSELPVYQFDCMVAATNNFSSDNLLGRGGFGEVYKGVLPSGQQVAVKRLSKTSGQGLEEFKTEAILIAKLQHRNLVRLLGCCMEKEEKMLIYEYLPNKSLDAFLFDPVKKEILDWRKRFDIIQGIAWGLLYLHRDSRLRIVHRDLKVSNILLDEDMNPKISDFGMARIFGANQNSENTTRVVGTFGYMSPEYAMEGLFSAKSDIYAFGVLVLEIISGKKNSTFHRTEGNTSNLIGHVWKLWKENRAIELADPSLGTSLPYEEIIRCIHIGILCVQDRAIDRPLMQSIVFMLGSESTTLPMPRQPTFTLDGSPGETESFSRLEQDYYTSSDVTFTSFTVRSE